MICCPVCSNKRTIGKVGSSQYYCWDCCVEFVVRDEATTVFNVENDGSLTLYLEPAEQII